MSELESSFPVVQNPKYRERKTERVSESDGKRDAEKKREREVGRINILKGEVHRSRGAVGLK